MIKRREFRSASITGPNTASQTHHLSKVILGHQLLKQLLLRLALIITSAAIALDKTDTVPDHLLRNHRVSEIDNKTQRENLTLNIRTLIIT